MNERLHMLLMRTMTFDIKNIFRFYYFIVDVDIVTRYVMVTICIKLSYGIFYFY